MEATAAKLPRKRYPRIVEALIETFGFSPILATLVVITVSVIAVGAVIWVWRSAPPRTLVLTSGPAGSSFQRYAESYQKALAARGIQLVLRPSSGSLDNLQRLQSSAPADRVDIGFVQGGLPKDTRIDGLVSLGSVAYQPLWLYYHHPTPITRLSELAGKRIAVGSVGSGTRSLATALLQANGISGAPTTFLEIESGAAANELMAGNLDAVFLMGESASIDTLRTLMRAPNVQLFSFTQADAYVRRFTYLNRIPLPEGSIDLGKNLPAQPVVLIGPTVELVARDTLNSALSDLLIEIAQDVHGKASLLQKRGEFPSGLEHEIPISSDALRYYKSGKGLTYRLIGSFWVASLVNRLLVAIVPLALVLIPALRLLPVVYRLGIQLRIYRSYRPLLRLEREASGPLTPERSEELLARLDEIEATARREKMPASFGGQFYLLRAHIAFVRQLVESANSPDTSASGGRDA